MVKFNTFISLLFLFFPVLQAGSELTSEQAGIRFNLKRDFVQFISQWEKKHIRYHSSHSYDENRSLLKLYNSKNILLEEGRVTLNDDDTYVRNGIWTRYYPDGSVSARFNYTHNLKDGNATGYYKNGRVALKCTYSMGSYSGKRLRYDSSGRILDSVDFSLSPPIYDIRFILVPSFQRPKQLPSGSVYDDTHKVWIKRDKENNYITIWYLNGELFCELNGMQVGTSQEKLHGQAIYWYKSGKVWMKGRYVQGKPAGEWEIYFEDGTLKEKTVPDSSIPGQDSINNTILP